MPNVSTKPIDGNFRAPEKARAKPKRIAAKKSGHPKPQWASVFESNLGDVPGYAYAVAHHGHVVDEGASGFARSAIDAPQTPWTTQTRINLASVSKCVTTVALFRLFERRHISINDPFYPLIETRCPTAGTGVDCDLQKPARNEERLSRGRDALDL
jgi:CubicO group peptidase (beta-lactamase class C family)